jgi:hypothetical protein
MCTFESEHSIVVCDLAIHQVRDAVSAAFGDAVQFTPITGQGTRVEVPPTVDEEAFQEVAHAAIAAAQGRPETPPNQQREELSHGLTSNQPSVTFSDSSIAEL